ncbi:MAG: hypothetical protein GWN58_53945 [Anaerolineae bacterium]|nr:hypothetical protein [Anaerolineae bacterium]
MSEQPVSFFWFPWCTGRYRKEFTDRKVPELEASGRYWGVRVVGYQIQVKLGRDQDGKTIWRKESE